MEKIVKKIDWLWLSEKVIIMASITLFVMLFADISNSEIKRQNENLTWQMENLAEGNSFIVLTRDYPSVFKSLEKQLRNPMKLMNGEEKVKFGIMEYNLLAHKTGERFRLKEVCVDKDDHLSHYRIEISNTQWKRPGNVPYTFKTMKITRY
jgi:hypothetical protein